MIRDQRSAIRRLCQDLSLPIGDSFTQDWAYELPEEFRDETSFHRYLSAYNRPEYGIDEKLLLMQLSLDIVNDLLQQEEEVGRRTWNAIADVLRENYELHKEQVEYWAMPGESLEDAFALTPLARTIREELSA